MYQSGLLLCNVPQSHNGISMDSHGQRCSCSAVYRQDLCDGLDTVRVAGITQNLQEQADVLDLTFGNSLCEKILDGLWAEMTYSNKLFQV